MLSIEKDFLWTCTAIDHPLYAFKFEYNRCETGRPVITLDILLNLKNDRFTWCSGTLEGGYGYQFEGINVKEFYEFAKQRIEQIL